MGNNNQKDKGPQVPLPPSPAEIKTFIMIAQTKLNLFRAKKINNIRKKKDEIVSSLKENNLDVAKAKMDSLIREEDYITSYDILGPLLEILKERVTYIISSNECPPDLRAQLDSVIYASTRLEFEELYKLRDLIMRKYGSAYIQKAENNVDQLVNVNLVEKLKIKPASDAFLIIRLKQLCKEKKIQFEFPTEIISDIPGDIGNPFGAPGNGNNPYGGDFNPYASAQGGNNPYGPKKEIILMVHHKEIILMLQIKEEIILLIHHNQEIIILLILNKIIIIHMDLHLVIIIWIILLLKIIIIII